MKLTSTHRLFFLVLLSLSLLLSACQAAQPTPTATLEPTATTEPTFTASPTDTEVPTNTPEPTNTPVPTHTPVPPTATSKPTEKSEPTATAKTQAKATEKVTEVASSTSEPAGDVKPETILAQSNLMMTQVETFKFKMDIMMEMAGEEATITADGEVIAPDQVYMKMTFLDQTIEMLMLSATEAYMRVGDSKWEAVPAEQLKQSGGANPDVLGQTQIGDFAESMTVEGIETIQGEKCYRIDYSMDMEKYFKKNLLNGQPVPPAQLKNFTAAGSIWIGVDDLHTYQYEMVMETKVENQKMITTTTIEFFDFNVPVKLPKPE